VTWTGRAFGYSTAVIGIISLVVVMLLAILVGWLAVLTGLMEATVGTYVLWRRGLVLLLSRPCQTARTR
jgi:hypothetical protein